MQESHAQDNMLLQMLILITAGARTELSYTYYLS